MKIDRMLEIVFILMNQDKVSARNLSERFGVSVRTIQRDMESLSLAGVPVTSLGGREGGYAILPSFRIKNGEVKEEEQQIIVKALQSLATTYSSEPLRSVMEKYHALVENKGQDKIYWDFGVTGENRPVQEKNALLQTAIKERKLVSFAYCNAKGDQSHRLVEPLAIHYKWYSWYLFAFWPQEKAYRTFKVARIRDLQIQGKADGWEHGDIQQRMKEAETAYYQTCIPIEIHFAKEEQSLMEEYFPDCPVEPIDEKTCRLFLHVPENERLWKALLLSFGDRVQVVGPDSYRRSLIETAEKFLSNYDRQVSHLDDTLGAST